MLNNCYVSFFIHRIVLVIYYFLIIRVERKIQILKILHCANALRLNFLIHFSYPSFLQPSRSVDIKFGHSVFKRSKG